MLSFWYQYNLCNKKIYFINLLDIFCESKIMELSSRKPSMLQWHLFNNTKITAVHKNKEILFTYYATYVVVSTKIVCSALYFNFAIAYITVNITCN